jgi:hypothetical protein
MADNLAVTPGSGALVATDQGSSSGAHFQEVKLAYSADGVETLVTADADGLEVQIGKAVDLTVKPLAGQVFPVSDNGGALSVDDAAGSLTVDAPAATPVAVRLSTGSAFIDTIPVSDASGSLTVDGTVTANQGTPVAVASAWPVKITDGTDPVGISTVSAAKALKVDVIQTVLQQADKSAFTEGTTKGLVVMGVRNDAITADPSEDQAAALRMTAKRGLHANLRNTAGTEIGTTTEPINVALRDTAALAYGETNPLPIKTARGEPRVTKSVAITASQTGSTVWDPTTGYKFVITDVIINLSVAGDLALFDATNAAGNLVTDGALPIGHIHLRFQVRPWPSATVDNILKYTSGTNITGTITVHGYEVV